MGPSDVGCWEIEKCEVTALEAPEPWCPQKWSMCLLPLENPAYAVQGVESGADGWSLVGFAPVQRTACAWHRGAVALSDERPSSTAGRSPNAAVLCTMHELPLRLALTVRGTVAGHRLGTHWGGAIII